MVLGHQVQGLVVVLNLDLAEVGQHQDQEELHAETQLLVHRTLRLAILLSDHPSHGLFHFSRG